MSDSNDITGPHFIGGGIRCSPGRVIYLDCLHHRPLCSCAAGDVGTAGLEEHRHLAVASRLGNTPLCQRGRIGQEGKQFVLPDGQPQLQAIE